MWVTIHHLRVGLQTNGAETLGFKVIVSCRDYKLTLDKCTVQICVAWRDFFFLSVVLNVIWSGARVRAINPNT